MSDNFSQPASGLMTPYSALVLFAVGLFLSNFVLNRLVMKNLFQENRSTGKCIFREFTGSCLRLAGRYDLVCRSGIQSDCVWSGGVCHFLRSGTGATMIAVIWGVFIWREFASAPAGTNKLLLTMFISYIVGIVLIIAANQ